MFFKVVRWEVNGTTFTKIMHRAFASMGLGHYQFSSLAQAIKSSSVITGSSPEEVGIVRALCAWSFVWQAALHKERGEEM